MMMMISLFCTDDSGDEDTSGDDDDDDDDLETKLQKIEPGKVDDHVQSPRAARVSQNQPAFSNVSLSHSYFAIIEHLACMLP
jgi:hypothetical protein